MNIDKKDLLNKIIDKTILYDLKWEISEKKEESEIFNSKIKVTDKKFLLFVMIRRDFKNSSPSFTLDVYYTTLNKPRTSLLKIDSPKDLYWKYVTGIYKSANPQVLDLYAIIKYYNYLNYHIPDYPAKLLRWTKTGLITWYKEGEDFICYDVVKDDRVWDKIDRDLLIKVNPDRVIIQLGDEVVNDIDDSASTPILYSLLKKGFEEELKENLEWDFEEYDIDDIRRCGSCGTIMDKNGNPILDMDILNNLTDNQIDNLELDWCYDCAMNQSMVDDPRYVTRDMAIDAGHPDWEGMPY